jgi:hypothetical protein
MGHRTLTIWIALAASTVPALAGPAGADKTLVARGAYLTRIMGCNDCHTPLKMGPKGPEPDLSRLLSGHPQDLAMPPAPSLGAGPWLWAGAATMTAFAGPWGTSYAANLTPDPETGIGSWTVKTFVDAIRNGRHEGAGRPILPPMPWQTVASATDGDLRAIFAYLNSIPPVRNRVPQPVDPPEGH